MCVESISISITHTRQIRREATVLKGLVEWTQTAAEKIKEKAFKYFSPEFRDTWTDEHGTKHNNVLFGGGITNRPFLKDLLPINLSELSFQDDPALPKENEVDPKQLRASIGLAEDATDEQVTERLGLIKTLSEAFPNGAPTPPKNDPPTPPAPPAPVFDFGGDIKQLAENNPQVAALVRFVESTVQQNQENAKKLVEQNVTMKLNEFDNSKLALTPVARDQVTALMLDEAMTPALRDKVWALMENMRNQSKFFVELGERSAYATHSRGVSGTTATQKYEGLVRQLMETDKIGYADAVVRISGDHPQLFEDYRAESTAWVE